MSEVIFYQVLLSAVELATFMFVIDRTDAMSPLNNVALIAILTILPQTFFFCKLSENITDRLEAIGNVFYGCSWYCLSAKQQQLFLLPIQRGQREFRMNGLGIVDCSLEIFWAVNTHWQRHLNNFTFIK